MNLPKDLEVGTGSLPAPPDQAWRQIWPGGGGAGPKASAQFDLWVCMLEAVLRRLL